MINWGLCLKFHVPSFRFQFQPNTEQQPDPNHTLSEVCDITLVHYWAMFIITITSHNSLLTMPICNLLYMQTELEKTQTPTPHWEKILKIKGTWEA